MKIRVLSDLHWEFGYLIKDSVPVIEDEKEMVLVLAGDISKANLPYSYVTMIEDLCTRHKFVIWLMGNHEYYHSAIDAGKDEVEQNIIDIVGLQSNLYLVDVGEFVIDDVHFICATLWTDYVDNGMIMKKANMVMSDHHVIWYDSENRGFFAEDAYKFHKWHRDFIFGTARKSDKKVVVVSHHAPSYQSLHPRFEGSDCNPMFMSDLDREIEGSDIKLWIHGHVHNSFDYKIGGTRIVCNPRGYYDSGLFENLVHNPSLVLEV